MQRIGSVLEMKLTYFIFIFKAYSSLKSAFWGQIKCFLNYSGMRHTY